MILIHRRNCTQWLLAGAACLMVCLVSPVVKASLLSGDSQRWGAGSITVDTSTNLRWLDMNLSVDFSYQQMRAEFEGGGRYAGFRHATQSEVEVLLLNAGISDLNKGSAANLSTSVALINMLGATSHSRGAAEIFGITGSMNGDKLVSGMLDHFYSDGASLFSAGVFGPGYGVDYKASRIGHWLVSTSEVPIPASVLLFNSALAGLVFARRRWHSR